MITLHDVYLIHYNENGIGEDIRISVHVILHETAAALLPIAVFYSH